MSRSYRRSPYTGRCGIAAGSMKWYRSYWNSKERHRWKDAIRRGDYDSAEACIPWNEWDSPRDGIYYDPEFFKTYKGKMK